jgi:putative ABC transport system permease protein
MVALGLTGVLWQSVTRRTREIGLRRAMGASGPNVHRQILAEVALLSTIAVIAGSIVILQLPILGAFKIVTPAAFTLGFVTSLATIYALTILCGLYPSWLASRLQPADALRYE